MVPSPSETFFLNVDLELTSTQNLQPLLDAFGDRVLIHRNDQDDAERFVAWMQFSSGEPSDLDDVVSQFNTLVEQLPPTVATMWTECEDRAFNLGVQAGISPNAVEFRMSQSSMQRIAKLGLRLVTTVYAFRPEERAGEHAAT